MAFSFGSPAPAPAPAPATGGFSFGSPAPAPAAGGFSFGSAAKSPAAAPASGGFGFGSTAATTSAFGATPAPAAPAPAVGGFGFGSTATTAVSAPAAPAPGSSFFGSAPAPATAPAFGAQPASIGPISSSSVYSNLPPQAQGVIDQIYNNALRNQRTIATIKTLEPRLLDKTNLAASGYVEEEKKSSSLDRISDHDEASDLYLPIQIESLQTQIQTVKTSIDQSLARVQELQSQSRKAASEVLSEGVWPMEALAARRGVQLTYFDTASEEKQKMERKMEHMLDREAALVDRQEQIPSQFMFNLLRTLEGRAAEIQRNIDLLQNQLDIVIRSNEDDQNTQHQPGYGRPKERRVTGEEISAIFKVQNDALLRVAGAVATAHDQLDALRARWRRYHGSADDPFRKADAEEILVKNRLEVKMRADMALARPPAPAAAVPAPAPASGGLFGTSTPAPASGGLFGTSAPAPASGGLFGTSAPVPAPATGSLFGSTIPAPAPATGGLFGTPAPTPATGGLFGSTPAPAPATGGLFGTPAPAPAAAGGLFGSTAPAGGLFGAPAPAAGGLFGAPAPAPSTGLLGSSSKPRSKNKSRSRR